MGEGRGMYRVLVAKQHFMTWALKFLYKLVDLARLAKVILILMYQHHILLL
jgi:hypothetical protein